MIYALEGIGRMECHAIKSVEMRVNLYKLQYCHYVALSFFNLVCIGIGILDFPMVIFVLNCMAMGDVGRTFQV